MSSYSSLLLLSPVDRIGAGYVDDDGDDMAVAASYLSFDNDVVGEDYYQPEAAAAVFRAEEQAPAVFRAEEQAPAPLLASPQGAEADSYNSGRAASSGGGGESCRQSQLETAMLGSSEGFSNSNMGSTSGGGARSRSSKIAFKTRSEVEVLDDGYRWRKYGKKMVKNSPNPRNYYRCSSEGCHVKKRVERERDDARFVITTYDGVHNHPTAPLPRGYPQGRRVEEGSSPPPQPVEGRLCFFDTMMKLHAAGAGDGGRQQGSTTAVPRAG